MVRVADQTILSFDHGAVSIGVAVVEAGSASATPIRTLTNDSGLNEEIKELIEKYEPQVLVVGWPRNLDGERTDQSRVAEQFAKSLEQTGLQVELQDEALSSKDATELLPNKATPAQKKALVHQYAAKLIAEHYIAEHP